jgi:hypothetical protein
MMVATLPHDLCPEGTNLPGVEPTPHDESNDFPFAGLVLRVCCAVTCHRLTSSDSPWSDAALMPIEFHWKPTRVRVLNEERVL